MNVNDYNYDFVGRHEIFLEDISLYKKLLYNFFYYSYKDIISLVAYDKSLAFNLDWMELDLPDNLVKLGYCNLSYNLKQSIFRLSYGSMLLNKEYTLIIGAFKELLSDCNLLEIDNNSTFSYELYYTKELLDSFYYETYYLLEEPRIRINKNTMIRTTNRYIVFGYDKFKIKYDKRFIAVGQDMFYILSNMYCFSVAYNYILTDNLIYYFSGIDDYVKLNGLLDFLESRCVINDTKFRCIIDIFDLHTDMLQAIVLKGKIGRIRKINANIQFRSKSHTYYLGD